MEEGPGPVEHVGELSGRRRGGGRRGQLVLDELSYPRRHHRSFTAARRASPLCTALHGRPVRSLTAPAPVLAVVL